MPDDETTDAGELGVGGGSMTLYIALQLMGVLALFLSVLFPSEHAPVLWPCPFDRAFDLPCPGCGLTRAFCAIGHGEFGAAWAFNPFAYVFYVGAVGAVLWPLVVWRRPDWERVVSNSRAVTFGAVLLVGSMWTFGLVRIVRVLVTRQTP
ncbi:MAG: DUF2752 domain-containing protein [Lentisphaeria bacterium]|nr:DUF2752 domain-containing protein [Lentisphaeria bacterium]